jgi:hypothetical protein
MPYDDDLLAGSREVDLRVTIRLFAIGQYPMRTTFPYRKAMTEPTSSISGPLSVPFPGRMRFQFVVSHGFEGAVEFPD